MTSNDMQEDSPYVFISYARPDQAVAEQVERRLRNEGVRVFRDTSEIREGANWDMTIELALRECTRMVVLLSQASMPYRKEVHREWFYFDQERKPLYPLYVEDCDRHTRFYAYNYIDARADMTNALDRLMTALQRPFDSPQANVGADRVGVFANIEVEPRTLPEILDALFEAVRHPEGAIVLSVEQVNALKDHKPADLNEYRLGRVAEWSLPRYQLDNRFVHLTLLIDKGESDPIRWQRPDETRFNDLRAVLAHAADPALVLLGAPGSGKSTLLRRFQLDHSIDRLRDSTEVVTFLVQLNGYRAPSSGMLTNPREWLSSRWRERYPALPPLDSFLKAGRVVLLLDGINEMPHISVADYHARVGLWRSFMQEAALTGNRFVFTCRSLDYSASLSSAELRVPQIEVQPMNAEQMRDFLRAYVPAHDAMIWKELDGSPQFGLFQTPYFLKLLCDQVEATRTIPKGRAALFTSFVRQVLQREINGELFQPDTLLSDRDHQKLSLRAWRTPFELPERGILIPKLSGLAFSMQSQVSQTDGAHLRIDFDAACDLLAHDRDADLIKAGVALSVLDEDLVQEEITFFHQLLQEFFAARILAERPDPALVHTEWEAEAVTPHLTDTFKKLADGDPLPLLPQTGWEETTLTAAPMSRDPNGFIRALMPHNLALAGRSAAAGEATITPALISELQSALIARGRDMRADLRARIAAGHALGALGDPRFARSTGAYGDYLLPPLASIPGGAYPIGSASDEHPDEQPAHTVDLVAFQIGVFPITNAEYRMFVAAGGYQEDRWWDSADALAWRRGEGSSDAQKEDWRGTRARLQAMSEDEIRDLIAQNRITSEQADEYIELRNASDEKFEEKLDEWYPSGITARQPEFWDDSNFNLPAQPVVGVTWFEARAYCAWLTANVGKGVYRLPTEIEIEAAARGTAGRSFAYGDRFEVERANTFESHIRRTTPIGIFDNATPEGVYDLSGNAFTWTLSIYDQESFSYPYRADDGRESLTAPDVARVLRGGSALNFQKFARASARDYYPPSERLDSFGFRVVYSEA